MSVMTRYISLRYVCRKPVHTILDLDPSTGAQYQNGMNALKHFRKKAGLSQQKLADAADTSQPQILRLEGSRRKLTKEWAERLAPHLGVSAETLMFPPDDFEIVPEGAGHVVDDSDGLEVPGEVAAGRFMSTEGAVDETVYDRAPITPDARYPKHAQYGLVVRGTSINRIAIDGDILHCVDIQASGHMPQSGELVIVEQIHLGGHMRERTAKVLKEVGDERFVELWPDSDDPKWQDPILIPHRVYSHHVEPDLKVEIRAFVIGSYRPLQIRRSAR